MKLKEWFSKLSKKTKIISAVVASVVVLGIGIGVTAYVIKENHVCDYERTTVAATCTEQGYTKRACKCGNYSMSYTKALGHNVTYATCTRAETCTRCDTVFSPALGHDFTNATCTTPQTCRRCNEMQGEIKGHNYINATCYSPATCATCGATKGNPLGHDADSATCDTSSVCNRCEALLSYPLGHNYAAATCTAPQICTRCEATRGEPKGHFFAPATCTSPQICKRCDIPQGEPAGHDYLDATCLTPATCSACGVTDGEPLGHTYADNICIRCNEVDPDSLPVNLGALHVIDSNKSGWKNDSITDSFGDTYNSGYYKYTLGSGTEFSTHNLRKEYSTFSGSIVCAQGMYDSVILAIYVDDTLVYTSPEFSKTTGIIHFSVDVTGGQKLTIKITKGHCYGDSYIALVNTQLTKS